jgi:hypothetical protein
VTAFAPYASPAAPPENPEEPTPAGQRSNLALAAVLWGVAVATIALLRYALSSTTAMP